MELIIFALKVFSVLVTFTLGIAVYYSIKDKESLLQGDPDPVKIVIFLTLYLTSLYAWTL